VGKSDGYLVFEVLSALGIASRRPFGEELRKHFPFGRSRTCKVETLEAEAPGRVSFVLREYTVGVEAVAVVELALQRVAEDFVSFRNAFEVLLCGGIARIDIRMIPASQLSKRFLDVVFGSRTDDFQDNIQIIETAHETPLGSCE